MRELFNQLAAALSLGIIAMYDLLSDFCKRPEPFSINTTKELWTRPHLAKKMLEYHLSQETDAASRRVAAIDQAVEWLDAQLRFSGKSLCDLGCGPGLYAERFAALGAKVVGIDFSRHSLDYAESRAPMSVKYLFADYLLDDLPMGFDIVTLIYTDLCALAFHQRQRLLKRMRDMLNPGGHIVVDVVGIGTLSQRVEATIIEPMLMGGFWSSDDYIGMQRTFLYPEQNLALDRFLIVEPNESWQIYNWAQYFTPESIEAELKDAGLKIQSMAGDLVGGPLVPDSELIGIIASAA